METTNKKGVQQLVLALAELGLSEVIICPGSRDAPLTIAFNRHPQFHCTSIRDERSAAFFALGKAMESDQPTAIVCTSGSASLNFAPAISEAYYQKIPLIVLTADRPKEWTDQGDGQTINQSNVYQNFILHSYELRGDATEKDELWALVRQVSEGFNLATVSNRGPVHFNIPLQEPLYDTATIEKQGPRIFRATETKKTLRPNDLAFYSKQYNESQKVMLLVGQHRPNKQLQAVLAKMASFENTIILTESIANQHHTHFVAHIDRCITHFTEKQAAAFMPDLLITLGGAIVSKRIKKMLRNHPPKAHWNIHPFNSTMDTYQSLTHAIAMEPVPFLQLLFTQIKSGHTDYRSMWLQLKAHIKASHEAFCKTVSYSDFYVFDQLFSSIPSDYHLHLSNSSPIRYAQLFDGDHVVSTWSNRGTSGIDGCTSTIVGAASASPEKKFLLLTGDVAFHYDKNALWNQEDIKNLKIIIVNNGGGNIFRIIDGPNTVEELETYFETSMQTNAQALASHYHWNYQAARDKNSLKAALKDFFDSQSSKTILEIFTDAQKGPRELSTYWHFLKEQMEHHEKN